MIKLSNINFAYQDEPLFRNLSLSIDGNKLTCLLGSSGSGKTTILRLIAGFEVPDNGLVEIGGETVTKHNNLYVPIHKRGVGFIFQDLALWPHFTVYKNIAFGLQERKEKNIKETVSKMLDFFNMSNYANKYPNELSGGQQQLVAIARALILKPKLLLMDEPLANLDVKLKRKILDHITRVKQNFDLTIVYVTHDHKEAFAIADKIVVINNGDIEASGTVEEIKSSDNEFVSGFLEF